MTPNRRGLTLVELMISLVMSAIIGSALLTMMLGLSRFTERSEGLRGARRAGRTAINVLVSELRMVDPAWGVESASATSVTLRVPYALGLVCSSTTSLQTLMLLPADSLALARPGLSGYAARGSDGTMSTVTASLTVAWPGSTPSACTSAGIQTISAPSSAPNAKTRPMTLGSAGLAVLPTGTPVLLFRRVRFYFGASAQSGLTGRTALWRDDLDDGMAATELAGPFDASAAFRFYNLAATTAQVAVPTLTDIRGFELFLPGESDRTSRRQAAPEQADMTTAVFFTNRKS